MKNLTKGVIILAVTISLLFVCLAIFAQIMSPGAGNGGSGGTNIYSGYSYLPPDYGTNLWLSISLSNNAVDLLLHNTQPSVAYLIRSREDLVSGAWFSEGTVTGAIAATTTPAIINIGERTQNLFIQALAWPTSNGTAETTLMLAIGGERIIELTTSGGVVSWGGNQYGELGDYTHLDSTNPVHVVGLTNIIKIASSLNYSLAIDSGGVLWAWGQLDNSQYATNVPTQVLGMTNIIAIAAYGPEGAPDPAVAVRADGTVWMWGVSWCDTYGFPPVQITGLSNAVSVAAGNCQTFALTTDGTVWMWGNGNEVPAPVSGLSNIVAICAGDYHTLALASNGVVWAWGNDSWGQLGDGGSESSSAAPVMVVGLTNVIGIAAGNRHSLAVDAQGNLWAWGDDSWGQLGDGGSAGSASLPFQVPGMSNIVSAAAGSDASVALDGNGNLWQWGDSDSDDTDWAWGDEAGLPVLAPQYVDFYNGQLPNLTILNGNNQTPHSGLEFPQPLVFQVTDTNGAALSNAPVSVEVVAGDMELRAVSGGGTYKGLRLTTDSNGEVSLIGYADQDFSNPNCVVRVLAASREQIVEADFNETLVSPPTILITSPGNGSLYLVGTNQPLTITVDAEAAPGASIQEVNYSYQFNGGGNTPLGASTQSPYSFIWTNSLWWTNAFVGQYTLSAVAVDDAGAQSDPQSVNITIALDSDGIGIPDYWQLQYFGYVGVDPNSSPDGNGQSLLYDYQNGIDPTDYYDGNLPNLEIVSGDNQVGASGSFLQQPLVVQVTDVNANGLSNAPVVFGTLDGNETFAATTNDTPVSTLTLRTGPDGQVPVWVCFSPAPGPDSQKRLISATAWSGNNSVAVTCNEFTLGRLGYWRFNTTEWLGEEGQVPLGAANLIIVPDWSVNAVEIDTSNQAFLAYRDVKANGMANILTRDGSIRFWFKPDWNSSTVNSGTGPGDEGRLIELGSQNSLDGWWALVLSPDGTTLSFNTQTNGVGMTNLTATISWNSNDWHQVVLTYSATSSSLYVDGQAVVTNGAGVSDYPDAAIRANGFYIGSDNAGNNQARGPFDELETFNYPLSLGEVTNDYNPLLLSPPTVSLVVTDGMCDTTLDQDQASEIISHVTGLGYPNLISFVVADNYADAVFAENAGLVDSESEGINITKLPPPVITPSSGYFNYPSNIVISLGAEDLTNLVAGLYQTELGRLGGSGELQTVIACAQGLRSEGQSDEDIRASLINGPYFRGSVEYADEFGGPGDVYGANTNYTIEYSLDNGVSWNTYNSPIQVTNSVTLQARVEKAGSSDNRTHYAYLDSDAAEAQFEYIPASWLEEYFGTNYQNNTNAAPDADPNNDGLNNLQEYQLGNNPTNVPNQRLGYWRFNTTEWLGEEGQVPLGFTNLASVPDWSGFALGVDTNLPAFLAYRVVEDNGDANISCGNGSVRFWFSSDWNSSTTNSGAGPGSLARLIELGSQDSADGWWALVLSPDGTTLNFITQTNGIGTTNLSATVNWASNDWHQVVLTCSATNSALYLDGQVVVANGAGVAYWPDATALANGFYIGSDNAGNNQARGQFDELETFNYQLSGALILSNYNTANPNGSGPVDYIGYLEGLNPLAHGATVPDTNGIVNLQIYTLLH